jgi:glucokinase
VGKIGIGLPGSITNSRVAGAGNVTVLTKIDVKKLVEQRYKTPVVLDNDVKAALRAEVPSYRKYQSIFMLTLGTGIGSAWWYGGKVMRGSFSTAYELGHMVIDVAAKKKLEKYSCARGFFLSRGIKDSLESEIKARQGSLYHKKLWQEFGFNLGVVLANIVNLIEPELIIIGGGMNHAWPLFIQEARKAMRYFVISAPARRKVKVVKSKNAKWNGAIGAAYLAKEIES